MSRKILAIIEVDEERAEELMTDATPGDYIEREFGWLEQSGISLRDWLISDEDDELRWARYINYLIEWAFGHSGEDFDGMSPACYDEWCDNEDTEGDNSESNLS